MGLEHPETQPDACKATGQAELAMIHKLNTRCALHLCMPAHVRSSAHMSPDSHLFVKPCCFKPSLKAKSTSSTLASCALYPCSPS